MSVGSMSQNDVTFSEIGRTFLENDAAFLEILLAFFENTAALNLIVQLQKLIILPWNLNVFTLNRLLKQPPTHLIDHPKARWH
jgi:hypothetical protein